MADRISVSSSMILALLSAAGAVTLTSDFSNSMVSLPCASGSHVARISLTAVAVAMFVDLTSFSVSCIS